ncbi:MAG: hypothetical protein FWH43_00535 [Endomicrobia bacterium]|nr:hypothetical protein [Endomicrobiia bacterium]
MKNKKVKVFRIDGKKYGNFIYDGCHKFYLVKDKKELETIDCNDLIRMDALPSIWRKSCPLRFINEYGTLKTIIPQYSGVHETSKDVCERNLSATV